MSNRPRRPRQTEFAFRTWGGRRAGAGRKPKGVRAGVAHVARPVLRREHPVHVTLRVVAGLPDLRNRAWLPAYERAFAAERDRRGFRLCQYTIAPNHLHLICEADDRLCLARGIQRLCIRLAKAINKHAARKGRVFADRYHRVTLTTPAQVRNALAYVILNEAKHLAERGVHVWGTDLFSSGRSFDGWLRAPPVNPYARGPAPTGRARSWLLAVGWRRAKAGLIRPGEVPGPGAW